jgi:ABC-2 type transport system permease protein
VTLARDTWLIFGRYWLLFLRNPVWVIVGIVQPVFYLLLFAPLLNGIAQSPGFPAGGAYNVFVPGLLIQLGLFGASGVGFGLIAELRNGVIERLRVTPVSRFAMLLGRALRDIVVLMIQALLLMLLALPFGLNIHPLGMLLMLGLLALLGLMMAPVSYAVALWLGNEDSFAPLIFTVSLPLLLLSGVLLPMSLAPTWLHDVSKVNPLTYVVDGTRALFAGDFSDVDVPVGIGVAVVLGALLAWWGTRTFQRQSA